MNRRRFIQSLAAVFSLPAGASLSLPSAVAVVPTATAVPANARFWAIYMSALHGECTPRTLQNMLHIPEVDAKRYVSQLIADGVIKPNPILQSAVTELVNGDDGSVLDRVKKRFDRKAEVHAKSREERRPVESEPEDLEVRDIPHVQSEDFDTPGDQEPEMVAETEVEEAADDTLGVVEDALERAQDIVECAAEQTPDLGEDAAERAPDTLERGN